MATHRISILILLVNFSLLLILLGGGRPNFDATAKPNRIFCFVLTSPLGLTSPKAHVYDSWAHECDGLKFITVLPSSLNKTRQEMFANKKSAELLYNGTLPLLQPYGYYEENYTALTTKVSSLVDAYKT
jgi:hypothetical protein